MWADHWNFSFTLLAALVPVKGAESCYYVLPKHFYFLWFLRCLSSCFVLFQIMCFANLFLCYSIVAFLVTVTCYCFLLLVSKNNNKMYTHLFLRWLKSWHLLPVINQLLWESQKYCQKSAVMVYWIISKELKSWLALFVSWLKQWDRKYWTD